MSTPTPPRASLDPIQQQLDELDALMQLMLELPVQPLDEGAGPGLGPASPPPGAGPDAAAAGVPAAANAAAPSRPAVPRPHGEGEANGTGAGTAAVPADRSAALHRPQPGRPGRTVAFWLQPLVWVNRAFDRWAGRLGAPGCWLRGPRGRALLGWTGLLLLTGTLLWRLLDWIDWTR